jgi:iron complex transport system substrate-binding protein
VIAALLSLALLGAGADPGPVRLLGPAPRGEVHRVVTLAPSLTEVVMALGAGDRLVGVSRFDERPEVARLPRVGGFVDPSVEAVMALHPDLILAQPGPGNRQAVETMARLGAPVLLLPLGTVAEVLAAERAAGKALGQAEKGEALARELETTRARIRERARALRPVRALLVYGHDPLVVAGPGGFAHELLEDAGAVNVAADAASPYPVYSVERVIRARPEVILDAATSMAGRDHLRALPALSDARWIELSDPALLHPGPALGRGLDQLFRLLHPEAAP